MKGIKSVYQLCAHCWSANSGLVSDLDCSSQLRKLRIIRKEYQGLGKP